MAWKATGEPTVRTQRDKWVVRVDGIDTETGRHRPRQIGTYASQRAAVAAARSALTADRNIERDGRLAGAALRRIPHRHLDPRSRAVRVGGPPHRGRARRRATRPPRPRRHHPLARRHRGGRPGARGRHQGGEPPPAQLTRPPSHCGDAHGRQHARPRRVARRRGHPRTQPGDPAACLRTRASRQRPGHRRPDRPARGWRGSAIAPETTSFLVVIIPRYLVR